MAYYLRRNYEKAVEYFERAIALNQATTEYYYELGLSYLYKEPEDCQNAVPWLLLRPQEVGRRHRLPGMAAILVFTLLTL